MDYIQDKERSTTRQSRRTHLRDGLGLVRLLRGVRGDTLRLDARGLGILLVVVGTEEIDIIVVFISSLAGRRGGSGCISTEESVSRGAGARERGELRGVRLDVVVPADDVGVGRRGSLRDGLEDDNIRLGRDVAGRREQILAIRTDFAEQMMRKIQRARL